MTFKELLKKENITGYELAKNTGIPYTTINDLINGKTIPQNVTLKNALLISHYLGIKIMDFANLSTQTPIKFRYFRSNLLHDLKRDGHKKLIEKVIKGKEIDYYYKNGAKEYALYLLALIDYLCRLYDLPIYTSRYNDLRKLTLDKPFFVGGDVVSFKTIQEAEKKLNIEVIPEFKKFNIIESTISNVA